MQSILPKGTFVTIDETFQGTARATFEEDSN
jgi:hypothetical protein